MRDPVCRSRHQCLFRGGNMNYYISDLHLFHENAIRFDERPFENIQDMHDAIRKKWNNKITNRDQVYILGDVCYKDKKEDLISFMATLKGHKILIKGNHDNIADQRFQQIYEEICDYKEVYDSANKENYRLVLCHYPIFSWKNMGRGAILLYGHTHNSPDDDYFQKCLSEMEENGCAYTYHTKPLAINVGCMKSWISYAPRSLAEILSAYEPSQLSEG